MINCGTGKGSEFQHKQNGSRKCCSWLRKPIKMVTILSIYGGEQFYFPCPENIREVFKTVRYCMENNGEGQLQHVMWIG